MTDLLELADIEAARALLTGVVKTTPLEHSMPLTRTLGVPTWLKCENQQRAGSYKVRGAYTRIARLSAAERARGVVAASAGNHAQGVALAAGMLGARSTVFMPEGAPLPKVSATKGYGATIEYAGTTVDDALAAAAAQTALGRMATVEDVAGAVLFLAGDTSRYISGVTLNVDGGV